jgi:2-polyprenyl-3-methyl-5-hydroxy-6-metoxy-1,4-benzoquinol methylase
MSKQKSSGLLSFVQNLYFQDIGNKFKPGTLKRFNSLLFILFEKIVIKFDIFLFDYINIYKLLVNEEIKLANISSNDSILVIGCGSIPSSCILLTQETEAKITGIDIDKKAVKKATNLINKLNLEKNIKIDKGNGAEYQVKNYDIIMILYGVKNLIKIFNHLSKDMKDHARIIIRAPESFNPENIEIKPILSKHFKQENKLLTKSFGTLNLYLLKKID